MDRARYINRGPGALKGDFAAPHHHRLEIPPLDARREDIPLLARALVLAARNPAAASRFVDADGPRPEARLDAAFVAHLVSREHPTNIRDLVHVLRLAMAASRDGVLRMTPEMEAAPERVATRPPATEDEPAPRSRAIRKT